MGVGLEMAPLIKEFIAKLIFNFKLEDEIALLPGSASTSTLAEVSLIITLNHIWSNFMRMHIGLKICHFLQSVVSIIEGPKNKIMSKSDIHSSVPCRDSALEQFLFSWVPKKIEKHGVSLGLSFMAEVLF